jgi:ankyrin repeat protein
MPANLFMQINIENPSPRDNIMILEVDCEGTGELCACLIGSNERPENIQGYQQAISTKEAYILTNTELNMVSRSGLAYCAMLVERDTAVANMNEAWVYMAVEVVPVHKSLPGRPKSWLLLHESPISTQERSGKDWTKFARELSDEDVLHGGKTPFHDAAEIGNQSMITKLLSENAALIMAQDQRGWTPLHSAAYKGQAGSILLLVQHGAPVDALDSSERSPLMIAADEGHTEAVNQLLNLGADVNLSSPKAQCPLNQALLRNHVETVRILLEAGANPNGRDKYGFAPMTVACRNLETANLLISAGADPCADLVGGATIIHFAARAGNVALIKRLLELDMPVDLPEGNTSNGITALYRAVEEHKLEAVKILLEHGANPNHAVQMGWTPVLLAAKLGNFEITKKLVRNGADTQTTCQPENWTALHVASQAGHRLVVRLLLDAGWDVNAQDSAGRTPLKLAETTGHEAVMEVLKQARGF